MPHHNLESRKRVAHPMLGVRSGRWGVKHLLSDAHRPLVKSIGSANVSHRSCFQVRHEPVDAVDYTDDNACFVCYGCSPFNFSTTIVYLLYPLSYSSIAPCQPSSEFYETFGPSKHGTDCVQGLPWVLDRQRQYSRLLPESNRVLLCRYNRVSAVSLSPLLRRVEGSFHPHPPGWNRTHGASSSGL
ncbi:hypothetical protein BJ912DRAFT_156488 [Pholiota molesta]|nr:hypothetical protein BJ912DRAFT_156488 [Pholiota molesta]